MNLANLRAFVCVAECGSFSQAGELLHLTQPAISKRIVALEHDLQARLFDRLGRRVQPTEAGRLLLEYAGRVLAELDDARRRIHDLSGNIRGRVGLGTSHHVGLHRMPSVLQAFKRDYPDVRLDLRFLESEAACAAVGAGELELAVVTLPRTPEARLVLEPLWYDPLQVVCAADDPLATSGPVSAAHLAGRPAILPGLETVTRQIVQQALADIGVEPSVELSTNHLETIRMMVAIGLGWSVLPQTLIDARLVALEVPGLAMGRTLGVAWLRGRTLSNAARAMLATLGRFAEPLTERR